MRFIILSFCIAILSSSVSAQGIEFFHGTLDEAFAKAQAEEKILFVDAYAQWCGPCKRMAKTTFKDDSVGKFFNANFINLKLDMEKGDGLKFRQTYPVSAFPTLFFLDPKGEVVQKVKGAQQVDGILKLGKSALSKVDYSADYAKLYEDGNREPELIYNYVRALNKSNKSSLKVSNDYINTQDDMNTDFNQKFILEAASEADSRIFDLLIKNKTNIERLTSKEEVATKIKKACQLTAAKAIKFESDDLLEVAKSKMKKHAPANAAAFAAQSDLNFYREMGNAKNYIKCCKNFVKKEAKNDADKLHDIAIEIKESFATNADAMKVAEQVAKKATSYDDSSIKYHLTYASILADNGKTNEALKIAKKSLDLAKDDKRAQMGINRFIKKLEQG